MSQDDVEAAKLLTRDEARRIAANSQAARAAAQDLKRLRHYSITLSARATNVAGTATPSALAVLRFITN